MDEAEEAGKSDQGERPYKAALVPKLLEEETQQSEVKKSDREKVPEIIHFRRGRKIFEECSRVQFEKVSEIDRRPHEDEGKVRG